MTTPTDPDLSLLPTLNHQLRTTLHYLHYTQHFLPQHPEFKPLTSLTFVLTQPQSYNYFLHLYQWLTQQLPQHNTFEHVDLLDDPTTVCTALIEHLQQCRYAQKDDLQVIKLRSGRGGSVLRVLLYMSNLVIEQQQVQCSEPQHEVADGEEEEAEDEQEIEDEVGEDVTQPTSETTQQHQQSAHATTSSQSTQPPKTQSLTSEEQQQWYKEIETLGNQLKYRVGGLISGNEYQSHITLIQTCLQNSALPNAATSAAAVKQPPTAADANLDQELVNLSKHLSALTERITMQEQRLTKQYMRLAEQYSALTDNQQQLQSQYGGVSAEVDSLQQQLVGLTEQHERLKQQINERDVVNKDQSPLKRLSTALNALKRESQALDVKLGVLQQQWISTQVRHRAHHAYSQHKQPKGILTNGEEDV